MNCTEGVKHTHTQRHTRLSRNRRVMSIGICYIRYVSYIYVHYTQRYVMSSEINVSADTPITKIEDIL